MTYRYPDFPNVETRQTVNALRVADGRGVSYPVPSNVVAKNAVPDWYQPESAYQVPGTQVFGTGRTWYQMPQNQDINHVPISLHIDEKMLYRSNLSAPRRDAPDSRIFAQSMTAPSNNARFLDGRKGDVYGA